MADLSVAYCTKSSDSCLNANDSTLEFMAYSIIMCN